MEADRKVTIYDKGVLARRASRPRASSRTLHGFGDIAHPAHRRPPSRCSSSAQAFVDAIRSGRAPVAERRARAWRWSRCSTALQRSMERGRRAGRARRRARRAVTAERRRASNLHVGDGRGARRGRRDRGQRRHPRRHARRRRRAHRRRRGARQAAQPGPRARPPSARRCRRSVVGDGATISTNAVVFAGVELGRGRDRRRPRQRPRALHASARDTRRRPRRHASRTTRVIGARVRIQAERVHHGVLHCSRTTSSSRPAWSPRTTTSWAAPSSATR